MKENKSKKEYFDELVETLLFVAKDKELFRAFFEDLTTRAERKSMSLRWQVVKRLHKGQTHRSIAGDLGLGISTVTRGSRELGDDNGGFTKTLKKLKK